MRAGNPSFDPVEFTPHRLADASDGLWQRFVDACPGTDFTYLHRYLDEGGS
jgi:hypothetical protein